MSAKRVRHLTANERCTWQPDIVAKLDAMQRAWAKSSGSERDGYLLGALVLCGSLRPLPYWLYTALRKLLTARLPQEPPRDWARWLLVREGRNKGLTWEGAYAYASDELADRPAAGKPDTIKKSYQKIQRSQRR